MLLRLIRRATRGTTFLVVGGGLLVGAAHGCTIGTTPPPRPTPVSNWTISQARAFEEFPLYWLGQSYEGLELTFVAQFTDGDGVRHAKFSYGEPSYFGDAASGSWHSPIEIGIQPYCGYSPEEVQSQRRYLDPEVATIQVRGVDAYVERYDHDWNYLTLWSGNSAIHISAHKTDFDIEQAAEELIPIGQDYGASDSPFPPPDTRDC